VQQDSALDKFSDGACDFGDGAAEPVDGGDNYGVAGAGVVQHRGQTRAGCFADPESTSVNALSVSTPAAVRAASCASRSWPVVLTRA
jgi:hypothetical protein